MIPHAFATAIRDAFESRHMPSPGLENRVLGAISSEVRRPAPRAPRLAAPLAGLLALLVIAVLVVPALLARLAIPVPIPGLEGGGAHARAYSVAAIGAEGAFVVQREFQTQPGPPVPTRNVLLETQDGGQSWKVRLRFDGLYLGMTANRNEAALWTVESTPRQASGPASWALTVYTSTDAGVTWHASPPTSFGVGDAYFINASQGWATGNQLGDRSSPDALYGTADGGTSWKRVGTLPTLRPTSWVYGVGSYEVVFAPVPGGLLRGWFNAGNALFTSIDGGVSWTPLTIAPPAGLEHSTMTVGQVTVRDSEGVLAVAFRDAAGRDNATANRVYVYQSHDGGATWGDPNSAPSAIAPVGDIFGMAALDPQHVWLTSISTTGGTDVQAPPAVARTVDGGRSWKVFNRTPRILNMAFSDPQHGLALSVSGPQNTNEILMTSDGGATWRRIDVPRIETARAP